MDDEREQDCEATTVFTYLLSMTYCVTVYNGCTMHHKLPETSSPILYVLHKETGHLRELVAVALFCVFC